MSTYTPIASVTLSSAQSSVTFSGIPQTYTDLVVVGSMRSDTTTFNNMNFPQVQFNGDTGSTYSNTTLYSRNTGGGWSALSTRSSNTDGINSGGIATTSFGSSIFSTYIVNVMNYTNTTTNKTVIARVGTGGDLTNMDGTSANVGLWRNTAAITSLRIVASSSGNFVAGSTFNLYGVANASITNVAKATGGDSVYTDGTYWYHIFRSSGTFTPTQALTADYLVVAGGGAADISGGSGGRSGGGGAGGLRSTVTATGGGGSLESPASFANGTAYTITVGAGGAINTSGSNSSIAGSGFTTITSTGGGKSGTYGGNGVTGGSGGGAGSNSGGSTGGAGTANQGYAGGSSNNDLAGGGGGGAGAVGGNNSSQTGGAGGAGVAVAITGSSVTYAGGGGAYGNTAGGAGGSGGGGTGGTGGGNSTAGTANLGGGGGGGSGVSTGTGGSGIVVLRYAV